MVWTESGAIRVVERSYDEFSIVQDMKLEELDPPIDLDHDHVPGPPDAELTLVEYGSYSCQRDHALV